jgi:hypothetical protein
MSGLGSQLSVAVATPVALVEVEPVPVTVMLIGQAITGGVVSVTVMFWVKVVVWPHVSLAVQVLRMDLLQSVPLDVSWKLAGLEPSQSSLAATVAAVGTSARHWTLSVASGSPLNTGPALSIRVL